MSEKKSPHGGNQPSQNSHIVRNSETTTDLKPGAPPPPPPPKDE